jgi:hypothetical protein
MKRKISGLNTTIMIISKLCKSTITNLLCFLLYNPIILFTMTVLAIYISAVPLCSLVIMSVGCIVTAPAIMFCLNPQYLFNTV